MARGRWLPPVDPREFDAWLIGYPGFMFSPFHWWSGVGQRRGIAAPPTLWEWRVMQASKVSSDVTALTIAYAFAAEGVPGFQVTGSTRAAVRARLMLGRLISPRLVGAAATPIGMIAIALTVAYLIPPDTGTIPGRVAPTGAY